MRAVVASAFVTVLVLVPLWTIERKAEESARHLDRIRMELEIIRKDIHAEVEATQKARELSHDDATIVDCVRGYEWCDPEEYRRIVRGRASITAPP